MIKVFFMPGAIIVAKKLFFNENKAFRVIGFWPCLVIMILVTIGR